MKNLASIFVLIFALAFIPASGQNYIIEYQYWCDTNFSANHIVSVLPAQQITLDTTLEFPGVQKGLHTYHIRFKQSNDFWSHSIDGYFFKTGESSNATGLIDAYRYWVEGADTSITYNLSTPMSPFDLNVALDLSWVHKGSNYLYIQFRDLQSNWSVASVDSFFKSSIPVSDFSTDDTLICSNDSVHLVNKSKDGDTYMWFFGDGDSSDVYEPVHHYAVPGFYTVSLITTDTTQGIDSTIILNNYIHVRPAATASFGFTQSFTQVTFINTSLNGSSYYWDFGDSTNSLLSDPVHTYLHDGNYTVILYVTDSCETVTDTQYVSMILSSAFSPDANPIDVVNENNVFKITFHESFESCFFSVINVSGQTMFADKSENIIAGSYKQIPLDRFSPGAYFLNIQTDKSRSTLLIRVIY